MMTILTYILTVVQYENENYRQAACHVIPFISLIMVDGAILCTVAIAAERVLIECFNFSVLGSRIRALIVSFLIICYAAGTNIDDIFIRRMTIDALGREIHISDFDGYPFWRTFDIVFSYNHIIFPWAAHCICSVCVLTTIARRKIFIHSTENKFCHVWLQQLYLHRDFFIPSICIIVCMLPHGIVSHLTEICVPYTDEFKLHLHILFVFFLFVPQMLTFILYVCPNEIYRKELQQTFFYRKFCCCCYQKQRKTQAVSVDAD